MYQVKCHIELEKFDFKYVCELQIEKSWKNFTSTASVKFPRKIKDRDKLLQDLVKRGDSIDISIGYDDTLINRFTGYVTSVKPTIPIEITCDDGMFLLKQKSVAPKSWKTCTVNDVLDYCGITNYDTLGTIQLGTFQVTPAMSNVVKVLEAIKDQTRLSVFMRSGKVIIGKQYDKTTANTHTFKFRYNIIEHDLSFKRKDEIKLKVTAISNKSDGTKIEVKVGDTEGEERTLNYYNLSESQLKDIATTEIDKLKYDGYRGKFTVFGIPAVEVGDIIDLKDDEYPERAGMFWVDAIEIKAGFGIGIRQEITLGAKT